MSAYFLDSSALVKRYRTEVGSAWITRLVEPSAGHTITICEITLSDRLAVNLTQSHELRGCDTIQLAAALCANRDLLAARLPPITFVASDGDLLAAASAAGLATEDPESYP